MTINARTLTPEQYAAQKATYLKDAHAVRAGRITESDFSLNEYTPTQRRELIDCDLAAIAAGAPKVGAAEPEPNGNTSNNALKPPLLKDKPPATVESMTDAQYTARKQAFIRGEL